MDTCRTHGQTDSEYSVNLAEHSVNHGRAHVEHLPFSTTIGQRLAAMVLLAGACVGLFSRRSIDYCILKSWRGAVGA